MEEVREGWRRSKKGRWSWADRTAEKMGGGEWGRRNQTLQKGRTENIAEGQKWAENRVGKVKEERRWAEQRGKKLHKYWDQGEGGSGLEVSRTVLVQIANHNQVMKYT